jgi:ribosome-binding ATPase YchF (GTP1/OBG family)
LSGGKADVLEELGLQDPGLDRLVKASYELLALVSFLTPAQGEPRWTIKKGTKAPQAAEKSTATLRRLSPRGGAAYDYLIREAPCRLQGKRLLNLGQDYVVRRGYHPFPLQRIAPTIQSTCAAPAGIVLSAGAMCCMGNPASRSKGGPP